MCSVLFVCISSKDAKCYPIRINDVWLDSLLNMYFTCNRHAMKLYLTQMFFVSFPLIIIVNCVPRVSLDGALSHEVCVFNCQRFQKFDPSWYSACLCIVVPVGGPYASGALSAFVRVSRQQKTYCHVLCVTLCHVWIFFSCRINNFQVQVQVQVQGAPLTCGRLRHPC